MFINLDKNKEVERSNESIKFFYKLLKLFGNFLDLGDLIRKRWGLYNLCL